MSLFNLDGRIALITGGSQGLGFAMAQALAEAGANVVVTSRQSEKAQASFMTGAALVFDGGWTAE